MTTMGELEDLFREAMAEPVLSAEEQIERRVDSIIREMDELVCMANNPETVDLIEAQAIGVGQIRFRAGMVLMFLEARKVPKLKMVQNNG